MPLHATSGVRDRQIKSVANSVTPERATPPSRGLCTAVNSTNVPASVRKLKKGVLSVLLGRQGRQILPHARARERKHDSTDKHMRRPREVEKAVPSVLIAPAAAPYRLPSGRERVLLLRWCGSDSDPLTLKRYSHSTQRLSELTGRPAPIGTNHAKRFFYDGNPDFPVCKMCVSGRAPLRCRRGKGGAIELFAAEE